MREANSTVAKQDADMKQLNAVIMEADKARRFEPRVCWTRVATHASMTA